MTDHELERAVKDLIVKASRQTQVSREAMKTVYADVYVPLRALSSFKHHQIYDSVFLDG